jgi:hypothetical protein
MPDTVRVRSALWFLLAALAGAPAAVAPAAALSSYAVSAEDAPGSSTGAPVVALGVPDYRFVNDAGLPYGGTNADVFSPGESTVLAFPVPIRNVEGQHDLLVSAFVGGAGATDSAQVRVDVSSDGASFETATTFDTAQGRDPAYYPGQETGFESVKHFKVELGSADYVTHVRLTNLAGTAEGLRLDAVEGLHPFVESSHAFEIRFERYNKDSVQRFLVRIKNLSDVGGEPIRELRITKPDAPSVRLEDTRRSIFATSGLARFLCVENCVGDNVPVIPFSRHAWSLDGVSEAPPGVGLAPGLQAGNRRSESFDVDDNSGGYLTAFSFAVTFADGFVHAFDYDDVLAQGARGAIYQKYLYFSSTPTLSGPRPTDTYELVGPPRCADGLDNDGDGRVDAPADPGCDDPADEAETAPALPCDDGVDNDGDGLVDHPDDPACADPLSPTEESACSDALDNDGDGLVDHPYDPGCASPASNLEDPACNNGSDDDGDLDIDFPRDLGCSASSDDTETAPTLPCDDGADNDGDGLVDRPDDPGCRTAWSATESPACDDGADNDGDGLADLADPQCGGRPWWGSEAPSAACGLGFELALLLPLLALRRVRAARS